MLLIILLLAATLLSTWPARYEDRTSDRVFEGEVWGDLTTEGDLWTEEASEFDHVDLSYRDPEGEGSLYVNVSNVSDIRLMDRREELNMTVHCPNGTFGIVTDNGSLDLYLSDQEFRCELLGYTADYPGDEEEWWPTITVGSVKGHGYLTNGRALEWYQHDGIELEGCLVIVDGVQYNGVEILLIPDRVTAYIEVEGRVEPPGWIRAPGCRSPHVNGSLDIDGFLHLRGHGSQMYEHISFEGEDISIRTTGISQYGTGGPFAWFDQWTIEVTVSEDATVRGEPAGDTPMWFETLLMAAIVLLALTIVWTWLRNRPRNLPGQGQS
jgi:hypothetical protein